MPFNRSDCICEPTGGFDAPWKVHVNHCHHILPCCCSATGHQEQVWMSVPCTGEVDLWRNSAIFRVGWVPLFPSHLMIFIYCSHENNVIKVEYFVTSKLTFKSMSLFKDDNTLVVDLGKYGVHFLLVLAGTWQTSRTPWAPCWWSMQEAARVMGSSTTQGDMPSDAKTGKFVFSGIKLLLLFVGSLPRKWNLTPPMCAGVHKREYRSLLHGMDLGPAHASYSVQTWVLVKGFLWFYSPFLFPTRIQNRTCMTKGRYMDKLCDERDYSETTYTCSPPIPVQSL